MTITPKQFNEAIQRGLDKIFQIQGRNGFLDNEAEILEAMKMPETDNIVHDNEKVDPIIEFYREWSSFDETQEDRSVRGHRTWKFIESYAKQRGEK